MIFASFLPALAGGSVASQTSSLWLQNYDATGHWWLSALVAAVPLLLLIVLLLAFGMKAHRAALLALLTAFVLAISVFHMPAKLAVLAALHGAAYGLFPIFWIIFPVIFMYELTVRAGRFALLQQCLTHVTQDSRLQLLLIAFAFGAFFEGAAGFGTPVAVCGTLLIGAGFPPIEAAAYALLANTAPVAFGALGTPVIALHGVTGIDTGVLSHLISALLTPFCILVPFWLIAAFAGFRAMTAVWPAIIVSGVTFGFTQLAVATFHGPWLVDIAASIVSIAALLLLLRFWKPRQILGTALQDLTLASDHTCTPSRQDIFRAVL
ncbi:MAG TPA: L-lactate permease, partial [Acidobacteriaceae bacterium]|nr:L-lactate permease [Acidobacteriaceae bacterium]